MNSIIKTNKEVYFEALEKGKAAEGTIGGCLRGGRVYKGVFSSIGPVNTFHAQKVEEIKDLKIHADQ